MVLARIQFWAVAASLAIAALAAAGSPAEAAADGFENPTVTQGEGHLHKPIDTSTKKFTLSLTRWTEHTELPGVCSNATLRPVRLFYHSDEVQERCEHAHRKLDIAMAYGREPIELVRKGQAFLDSLPAVASRRPCFVMVSGYYTANDTFNSSSRVHLPLAHAVIEASAAGHEFPRECSRTTHARLHAGAPRSHAGACRHRRVHACPCTACACACSPAHAHAVSRKHRLAKKKCPPPSPRAAPQASSRTC